ncbi:hypothetical protein [Nocardioides sp. L-11A]|uniref:hypothetical protein n=1 Tax=Nocardioides sp. L-11A TaxID=3043848 RepID=UPI00249CD9F1|nr:hypothetical protein QJ852_09790 [Nocardioides sp. L-11A]
MTTSYHHYDEEGRLARTVTEPVWTDLDRALLMAYQRYLGSLCPGECGQPKALAHHPANDGWYGIADTVICHACTALKRAANEGSKEPVKPVEFHVLNHDRDYQANPLPQLDLDRDLDRPRDLPAGWAA